MLTVATPPVDPAAMRRAADDACRLMRVLANPDRLLLCQLAQGDCRVGELEHASGIVQPTLSQQLGVLREEGLVEAAREGRHVRYGIRSPQALALLRVLQEQFCHPTTTRQS
jgi:DNA-binding transcriptional ArsR family regulator